MTTVKGTSVVEDLFWGDSNIDDTDNYTSKEDTSDTKTDSGREL